MTRRIAMWSGPRNISTTMMRSFSARADCAAIDEPFYAFYLDQTGINHPFREETLESQPGDWREVVATLTGGSCPVPLQFQKHMCQHMLPEIDLAFLENLEHFFLIRDPARMVASFADRFDEVTPEALGLPRQIELYDQITTMAGQAPPVIDAADILRDPPQMLQKLCVALNIPWTDDMLSWGAGPHEADGIWAPHWYQSVWKSTGFKPYRESDFDLSGNLRAIAQECQPFYDRLAARKIAPDTE